MHALLLIIRASKQKSGIEVEQSDISVARRVLAQFADRAAEAHAERLWALGVGG